MPNVLIAPKLALELKFRFSVSPAPLNDAPDSEEALSVAPESLIGVPASATAPVYVWPLIVVTFPLNDVVPLTANVPSASEEPTGPLNTPLPATAKPLSALLPPVAALSTVLPNVTELAVDPELAVNVIIADPNVTGPL